MAYKTLIRDNETGEERIAHHDLDWQEGSLFWHTGGNYGCDCNRGLEFQRAGGLPENELTRLECGHGRYTVVYAELEGGTRIPIDPVTVDFTR